MRQPEDCIIKGEILKILERGTVAGEAVVREKRSTYTGIRSVVSIEKGRSDWGKDTLWSST